MILSKEVTNSNSIKVFNGLEAIFNNVHEYKYNYNYVVYKNMKTKINIECRIHGIFKQTPDSHKKGNGCPKCGAKQMRELKRDNIKIFIEKANAVHKNLYDYSKSLYVASSVKLTITCPLHGDFDITPNAHLRGSGCNKCGILRSSKKQRMSKQEFIDRANKKHNNFYSYELVDYKNVDTKVKINCPAHGVFTQTPYVHFRSKCPHCARSGFDTNKPGILYIAEVYTKEKIIYKLGITGRTFNSRYRPKERRNMKLLREIPYSDGKECFKAELDLKHKLQEFRYRPLEQILITGDSELFTVNPEEFL